MSMPGRDPATENETGTPANGLAEALALMERALHLIDEHDGPADVGANLDLAIHRLKEWIETQIR